MEATMMIDRETLEMLAVLNSPRIPPAPID